MKKALIFLFVIAAAIASTRAQTCSTCGKLNAGRSSGRDIGPKFSASLGAAQYGRSAGHLIFSSSLPDPLLFTPAALQFTRTTNNVTVIMTNEIMTVTTPEISPGAVIVTNVTLFTNTMPNVDWNFITNMMANVTNTLFIVVTNADQSLDLTAINTNTAFDQVLGMTTNMVATMVTNAAIRQVQAPQAIADVPVPPTFNGYVINLYYPTNIVGTNLDGTFQFSVPPFITWLVTNPAPATINQLQISETNYAYGSLKQWTYTYDPNSGAWSVQDLAGVQENMIITNINSTAYQIINTWQYSGGPVVQQTKTTYTNFSWGKAPIQIAVGSDSAPQTTTYTYYDPSPFGSGSPVPVNTVIHPDGSWEYYASYDPSGNPLIVYSSYGDAAVDDTSNGRQTVYVYDPGSAGVSDSGDNGTANPNVPRQTITYVQGQEISCSYTVFPSVSERLDIQCTASYPNDQWNSAGNLVTTNLFYTSGPNQFALQAVIRPDGTATVYNYITNGICQTNITVTGQPDSTLTNIVDGVSNVTVLNSAGYNVSVATYDVASHFPLSEDTYGYFDNYGRPQQVIHLDGTTETMNYACCGLDNTTDRDGVYTQYLYDPAKRQIGYARYVDGANSITYTNVLDAAGRVLKSVRIGSDNSSITRSQSTYDQAGELINQTNALGGGTTYTRTNDPNTGGLIRTTIYPNGGAVTNFYYADGSLKETIGTAVHGKGYGYGYGTDTNGNACTYSVETNLNSNGSLSSEWTQTYTDMAGRTTETLYADGHCSQSFYNSQGQLWKQIDPDGIVTLYQYNAKGEQTCKAVAMNQSETSINFSSDRVTGTTNVVTTDHGANVRFIGTYIWTANNNSSSTLVSTIETSTSGLTNWQTQYRDTSTAVTTTNQTSYSGTSRTTITIAPDNSYTISTYSYGRLVSSTRYDSGYNPIASTSYSYDSHGRQSTATDARNGATTYGYNNADLVTNVITPNPGTLGGSPETTTTSYNMMLQPTGVVQPDGTSVTTVYLLTGELGLQYGSRTYPVGYSYDYAGRMKTMTNWSNYSGGTGTRVTTWNYDGYRGFLTSKTYDNSTPGPSYVYTAAGRLASRTWARGITTTYGYNIAGDLATVVYSDTTPDVTNTYDRLGHPIQISGTNSTESLAYNLANELLSESYSGGLLNGLSVTNAYDSFLRRTAVALSNQPSTLIQFGYDNASRLLLVTNGLSTATYTYLANSPLVGQITFKSNSVTSMTTGKTYDYLNRLTGISSVGTASPISFNYNYNSANQRTRNALADGSYWIYQYDSLGQVTSGCKYWSDGTPVAGQQFDYTFDDIGNRKQTLSGGDQSGAGLRPASYSVNSLNQLTNRDVPAYVDIKGVSFATNLVTVNGQTAYRKVEYFRDELGVNNTASALWTNIVVAATGQASVTGNVFVAKEPEQFSYDADGNLTNDGRFSYTWDGENRLINLTSLTNAPMGSKVKLYFAYDFQGRRIQKIVSTNYTTGTNYTAQYTNRFVYDGWNLIAEVAPNNSLVRSYVWGTDLSGSLQGAGGVGGLLEMSYYGSATTNCFPAFDGNGNVAALINAADGTVAANYEYGPFGEVIRATGLMAKNNPFRFSTKYDDDESDLLYYGYRYYKPSTGTWPNRDPLSEYSFLRMPSFPTALAIQTSDLVGSQTSEFNGYIFVANEPLTRIDILGCICDCPFTVVTNVMTDAKGALLDNGGVCDASTVGTTFTTTYTLNCSENFWSGLLHCDCLKRTCKGQVQRKCMRNPGNNPFVHQPFVLLTTGGSVVQNCRLP